MNEFPNGIDLGRFVDWVWALKAERDEALAREAVLSGKVETMRRYNNEANAQNDQLREQVAKLRHVGLELSGTMHEYRLMPCQSLADRMFATYDRYIGRLAPAAVDCADGEKAKNVEPAIDLDAGAQVLAECFDYPWEHMPEQGRESMRQHVKRVLEAAKQ